MDKIDTENEEILLAQIVCTAREFLNADKESLGLLLKTHHIATVRRSELIEWRRKQQASTVRCYALKARLQALFDQLDWVRRTAEREWARGRTQRIGG